jgi:hypothetical protein
MTGVTPQTFKEVKYMSKTTGLKPGVKAPLSGQYKNTSTKTEVTSVKGEPLPPGPKGSTYNLADKTKHKR